MNSPGRRSRSNLRAMIAVNALLLGALAFVTFSSVAPAQAFRSRGVYHMVAGNTSGSDAAVVFVVDEANQQLVALGFDANTKTMRGVGARDLGTDINRSRGARN